MKRRIVQLSRHSVCCFFMLTSIGCSKLSDQLGVKAKAHTSATAVSNKKVRKSVNAQRESEVVAIPKMQTWLTVMMILSQVQPAVGNGNAAFCSNLQSWKNKYTAFLNRRSDFSSFFNGVYAFYCNYKSDKCNKYDTCILEWEKHKNNIANYFSNHQTKLQELNSQKLNAQPSSVQGSKQEKLRKLRNDKVLLSRRFFSQESREFPFCSQSFYFDVCSKNGQDPVYSNYAVCASSVCHLNRCGHNGESHRGKREVIDKVTRNSQKKESEVYAKRPTQGKSSRSSHIGKR
ncbi:hypothetical protein [Candidatus Cardinium hertigii]|uniref:Lipoprotein n=1 Tax=Candidatus Cardinium hertigii TaxID=247481 RepID=A0A2Z3LEZ8_9BACT|nr:hypothetical protein [Candidatus Cardinium hertigii]AWN82256.1 hypothetical protein DK880_00959 [Candidatus Cardinium hertigii]